MEQFLEALKTRTLFRFKRAHILRASDETLFNLDFNVSAKTREELIAAMGAVASGLQKTSLLSGAPVSEWQKFVANQQKPEIFSAHVPGTMRKITFMVRDA